MRARPKESSWAAVQYVHNVQVSYIVLPGAAKAVRERAGQGRRENVRGRVEGRPRLHQVHPVSVASGGQHRGGLSADGTAFRGVVFSGMESAAHGDHRRRQHLEGVSCPPCTAPWYCLCPAPLVLLPCSASVLPPCTASVLSWPLRAPLVLPLHPPSHLVLPPCTAFLYCHLVLPPLLALVTF